MPDAGIAGTAAGFFGLGLSIGLGLLLLATRDVSRVVAALNPWLARGLVALVGIASIAIILISDKEPSKSSDGVAAASRAMVAASGSPAMPQGPAGPMEAATQALEARLAAQGGSDEDWNLLAQSYEFMGRGEDEARARQKKIAPQGSLTSAMAATAPVRPMPAAPGKTPAALPADGSAGSLVAQAEEHRRKREFPQAIEAYRKLVAANAMTADSWADYADALASAPGGSLGGESAKAVDRALALNPKHTKALWLKASLAHEQRRYDEALATWRALLAQMPAGSSDARIIEANIAEAQRLAGRKG